MVRPNDIDLHINATKTDFSIKLENEKKKYYFYNDEKGLWEN